MLWCNLLYFQPDSSPIEGVAVSRITEGGPADITGICINDHILKVQCQIVHYFFLTVIALIFFLPFFPHHNYLSNWSEAKEAL